MVCIMCYLQLKATAVVIFLRVLAVYDLFVSNLIAMMNIEKQMQTCDRSSARSTFMPWSL